MKTKVMGTICVLISIFLTSACATGKIDAPQALAEEPTVGGNALEETVGEEATSTAETPQTEKASTSGPLGAQTNPIRCHMPSGQQAYLRRLRDAKGRQPSFHRVGSFGLGRAQRVIFPGFQKVQQPVLAVRA